MDLNLQILGKPPGTQEFADALMVAAGTLEKDTCYSFDGRFHFSIGSGWTIALSSDSADRMRVESCRLSAPKQAMWVLAENHDRLANLVVKMLDEVLERV
jgi:hypothetical protein